jgi:hypothetical protein
MQSHRMSGHLLEYTNRPPPRQSNPIIRRVPHVGIGGLFDRHGCDHATQAHCAEDRHDLPVATRCGFMDALASQTTRPLHQASSG